MLVLTDTRFFVYEDSHISAACMPYEVKALRLTHAKPKEVAEISFTIKAMDFRVVSKDLELALRINDELNFLL
tara:strand:+ start:13520 stop:13738 length:219 start_codon:yes stop_codon:yes gene_type:complete